MIIILATIMSIATPTEEISPYNLLVYLGMRGILLEIGVDGDEPMSSSVTSERSNLRKRGMMLAYILEPGLGQLHRKPLDHNYCLGNL